MSIEIGATGDASLTVDDADTAAALGSGDVAVYATPAIVALCERAAVAAVVSGLGPDETTVGTKIDLEHLAPTLPGALVRASARVVAVDGRRIDLEVEATDPAGPVARGRHTRMRLDRDRFLASARDRGA